ncbi:MAG: preprotein translocase subunit SecA [Chloroflexi bacterium]|nr:preprotein translocase subunit SecA [Chloroflexota bacterium]
MVTKLIGLLGDSNEKQLKRLRPLVRQISDLEPAFQALSEEALRAKTDEFRTRLNSGESLDDILPEAFAAVREAATRTIGLRHFDVQLMGGIVLHQGKIAEMKTGEGKTLVATLSLYLNALAGYGAHLVTVNDYLAKRDTQWMGPIYHALGLTVGCLQHESAYLFAPEHSSDNPSLARLRPASRQEAYRADITYGTNNEFGFDFLRDNMVTSLGGRVQRELPYAIVDEVDNILIDEARTPLIISGPAEESTKLYTTFARLVPRLRPEEDYKIDQKEKNTTLTEAGIGRMEQWLNVGNLYDPSNYVLTHYVENALRAEVLFKRDRDYVVRDGEVVIVDEFTGRLMLGRRYSDGLHQAIEAKEGVAVQRESITYATITLQNYFRMYEKLAGMTGTAATEAEEFWKIYKLDVVVVPTHRTMVRRDLSDLVFKTEEAKFKAAANAIEELHRQKQPVLVGTVSIEKSERLSELLTRRGVPHQVLNAKYHEKEAVIVAQAGKPGAVTVATNMAGRGTDIVLGGDPRAAESQEEWQREHDLVVSLGGLHILGTERHEARRIDNQLRGRSGRQGDPGSSRFYISLEDDLMRRFGGDRIRSVMNLFGIADDTPLESRLVSRSVEAAQSKVEAYHFDIRKHLVEYDDVVNRHRDVIYTERRKVLGGADLKANIQEMIRTEIASLVSRHLAGDPERWQVDPFLAEMKTIYPLPVGLTEEELPKLATEEAKERALAHAETLYEQRERDFGPAMMRELERLVMLQVIDAHWVQHLTAMENLRQGIGLHAYSQQDPLVVYKREGHQMFEALLGRIQHDIVHTIFHLAPMAAHPVSRQPATDGGQPSGPRERRVVASGSGVTTVMSAVAGSGRTAAAAGGKKVGRNDPCPCGSGKKYKRCHGGAA